MSAIATDYDPIFDVYLERLKRLRRKPRTIRNVEGTKRFWLDSGLSVDASDIEIEEWLLALPVSDRTRQLHLDNVRAAFRYARRAGRIDRDPTDLVKLPAIPDKEPVIIPTDELREIKALIYDDQQALLFHLLAYTGMRRREIGDLLWDDVKDLDILVRQGKGDKLRWVPIHPALGEILAEYRRPDGAVLRGWQGEVLSEGALWSRLRKLTTRRYHDFRRTVATSLYENDVPERLIEDILGWAPRTVGKRFYRRGSSEKAHEAILKLYADDPL